MTIPAFAQRSKTKVMNSEVRYITYHNARTAQRSGQGIIIDVREPAEFRDGHLPGAINLPSSRFSPDIYRSWSPRKISLVCQTGDRARSIAQQLGEASLDDVYVLDQHMEEIPTQVTSKIWSVDRQFRFLLGVLLGLFLVGYQWISAWFLLIPVVLCLGLTITAIIDKCYLRVGIAMLPWNREQPE